MAVVLVGAGATAALRWHPQAAARRPAAARLPVVGYRLEGAGRAPVAVRLEVAADPRSRQLGLAGRGQVAPGTGMVFLFPGDTRAAFWMKDTRVPLAIAFVRADGRVVGLAEMAPCLADPCRLYTAPAPYRYAVELGAGGFRAAGVRVGDRVVPADPADLPTAE